MTLLIALNIDDYYILAADQRVTLECEPFTNLPKKCYTDGFKKLRLWNHGAFAASGDLILVEYLYQLLQEEVNENSFEILKIAKKAKMLRLNENLSNERSTGCAIFTAKLLNKTVLIHLSINENSVEYEFIEPMQSFLSLGGGDPNDPVYHYFADLLKERYWFDNFENFLDYHLNLVKNFIRRQKGFDNSITPIFDFIIQSSKTGQGYSLDNIDSRELYLLADYLDRQI
ncbi:hypothetical protein QR665_13470 [Acinetobacter gerneri]|uniref:hypothetical protein n=1 Tax=Acinetobacter gerneri TaxID=202952 RepID=UPI002936D314|nr:hypothetical protein [Acinetobacter gerneri]MDV2440475.1 hypothetical protein [Acinetobacter gerneri]